MVRRFFEENAGRIDGILTDTVVLADRFKWQPSEIEALEFKEFCLYADGVREIHKREAEANKPPG